MITLEQNQYLSLSRTKTLELALRFRDNNKVELFFTNGYVTSYIIVYDNLTWAYDGLFYNIPKKLIKALERFIQDNKELVK